jgi:hypothetical protein
MFNRILISSFVGFLLASCADETPAPDVVAFRQLNEQLAAAVDTHQTNTAAMPDMAGCTAERDRYEAEVRPIVDKMRDLSTGMDDCMMAMGRDSMADMQKTCGGMTDELTTHMGAACESSDLSQDRAESERHCNAMRRMAEQEIGRADNMMQRGGMMSGMMSGGTCHD